MHCFFFAWPVVFEDSLKYQLFSSVAKKVVFAAQERLSSLALIHMYHLTYIDLKEVFDLFLRNTQGSLSLAHY